jgi:hypothetical protein
MFFFVNHRTFGGARGRGSPGKMPFVMAVETTQTGKGPSCKAAAQLRKLG